MSPDRQWAVSAEEAWRSLISAATTRLLGPVRVHEPGRLRVVFAWPLSQVLHTSVLLEAAHADAGRLGSGEVWRAFRRYRRADGFLDVPWVGQRYYDDNAWIGLACSQAALLSDGPVAAAWSRRAARSLSFVSQGLRSGGGVLWVEGGENLHACSTGSAGALAAAVGRVSPWQGAWRQTVEQTVGFLERSLLRGDGLVADHISPDGRRDEGTYTYNQGLLVQLRLATGDTAGAAAAAAATLGAFPPERMDSHPAAFNAIFFRALLRLWAETGDRRWRLETLDYLQRCWTTGRDERGLFTRVGRYDAGVVLDHAALVGLMAAASLQRQQAALLV